MLPNHKVIIAVYLETWQIADIPAHRYIKEYLDLPKIREVLGVSPKVGNYSGCSNDVGIDFNEHLDSARMTKWYVEGLLERGIKILVYVGTYDWIWYAPHALSFSS